MIRAAYKSSSMQVMRMAMSMRAMRIMPVALASGTA